MPASQSDRPSRKSWFHILSSCCCLAGGTRKRHARVAAAYRKSKHFFKRRRHSGDNIDRENKETSHQRTAICSKSAKHLSKEISTRARGKGVMMMVREGRHLVNASAANDIVFCCRLVESSGSMNRENGTRICSRAASTGEIS